MRRPEWVEAHAGKFGLLGLGLTGVITLASLFRLPDLPFWLAKILFGVSILLIVVPIGMMLPWFKPSVSATRNSLTALIALGSTLAARLAPDTTESLAEIEPTVTAWHDAADRVLHENFGSEAVVASYSGADLPHLTYQWREREPEPRRAELWNGLQKRLVRLEQYRAELSGE